MRGVEGSVKIDSSNSVASGEVEAEMECGLG